MDYLDFEVDIAPENGGTYPVRAACSVAGEAHENMQFPFDQQALGIQLSALQNALLSSGASTAQMVVQNFGKALFNALFVGDVRSLYAVSRNRASSQGNGLRLQLRIQPAELVAVPWEFMYDSGQATYLCLSDDTPVVRYIELPVPPQPLAVAPPLSILGMAVSPKDLVGLDVEREKQRIETAIAGLQAQGLAQLTWLQGSTWEDLQTAMLRGPWHIFHFIGHGVFNPNTNEGIIAFEDSTGQAHYLQGTQLGLLLADHHPLRLVVLNSCEGAQSSTHDIFSSTAATLVQRGIPAVLANQYEISDQAAIELSRTFYGVIADGRPVDMAVCEARKAISLAVDNTVEWGTPVLYMRAPDGVLFDVIPPSAPSSATRIVLSSEIVTAQPPSPQPPATRVIPTATGNPYPPTTGMLAFADPLSQPFRWDAYSVDAAGGPSVFIDGAYHISQPKSQSPYFTLSVVQPFSNFAFEVEVVIIHGDRGGIIFRCDDTDTKYYLFQVWASGYYSLYVQIDNTNFKTLASDASPAITIGLNQTNLLAVVANGSTLDLYVNHTKLGSVTDSTYTSGYIGLQVESETNPTEVAFKNAKLWTW